MSRNEIYELVKDDILKTIRSYLPEKVIVNPIFTDKNCMSTCISSKRSDTGIKKRLNYFDSYRYHLDDGNFVFLLFDGSFVQFDYQFQLDGSKKKVSKATLSFYPVADPYLAEPDEHSPSWYKLYYEEIKSIEERYSDYQKEGNNAYETTLLFYHGSKYIRIDYSSEEKDYTEAIHPRCHIHIGMNDNFRLGTSKVPLVSEFLDIILYLNYIKVWECLNGKATDNNYLIKHLARIKNKKKLSVNEDLLTCLERDYCHFCM